MLELKGLSKHFGGVKAVDGLDLNVKSGEIFGLIGPNGSGKSTTINLICGLMDVTAGNIAIDGRDISGAAPHEVVNAGIGRTFQNIRLFQGLTVWQNLWVAQKESQNGNESGFFRRWLSGRGNARENIKNQLDFARLSDKRDILAGNLSFGEQRRLELARAMATTPKMLLLDEPAAGMNQEEVKQLETRLRTLKESGLTILLVEHVMELVMGVTDRIAVLNFGQKIAEGTPSEIQNNQSVQDAYLGKAS
jgi:ABC-type branched-subunit amino acid transport system ATPase component